LHGRRLAGKHQRPTIGHVHRQVHQNVDLVLADHLRDVRMQLAHAITPSIGIGADALRVFVGLGHAGVAEDFKLPVVVMR
jgi:hypothetical protein